MLVRCHATLTKALALTWTGPTGVRGGTSGRSMVAKWATTLASSTTAATFVLDGLASTFRAPQLIPAALQANVGIVRVNRAMDVDDPSGKLVRRP